MPKHFRFLVSIIAFYFLHSLNIDAQIFQDSTTLKLVKEEIAYIYDLKFDKAQEVFTEIKTAYPSHPIVFLLKGLMIYWENYPLLSTSTIARDSLEKDLRQCMKISEKEINHEYEAEYLLADLCARGLLLMFYDDNDLILEVTPLTISTYKHLRNAFNHMPEAIDLDYFTGVYNYFREAYPVMYPVYKSLAFLFPKGSIREGLAQLQLAAKSSVVMKAESAVILIWIYLGYENNPAQSAQYSKYLFENYPDNVFFSEINVRNLLILKHYDEAEIIIQSSPEDVSKFYEGQMEIMKGIIQEKKYHDLNLAEQLYNSGISKLSEYGRYGKEFAAYGYFGLSRISEINGEKNASKSYAAQANKLADIKRITFDK